MLRQQAAALRSQNAVRGVEWSLHFSRANLHQQNFTCQHGKAQEQCPFLWLGTQHHQTVASRQIHGQTTEKLPLIVQLSFGNCKEFSYSSKSCVWLCFQDGFSVDVVFLDLAKAFDKEPHKRSLEKLNKHGIGGKLLSVIGNWLSLSNRKQRPKGMY